LRISALQMLQLSVHVLPSCNPVYPQTNNPRKIRLLEELGVTVTGRIPCLVKPGEYSKGYLEAKGKRMEHMDLDGSFCYWNHSGEKEPAHPPKPIDEQTF
jgi:hypothetical protein